MVQWDSGQDLFRLKQVMDALDNAEGWTILSEYDKIVLIALLISKCSQRNPMAATSTATTANNERTTNNEQRT